MEISFYSTFWGILVYGSSSVATLFVWFKTQIFFPLIFEPSSFIIIIIIFFIFCLYVKDHIPIKFSFRLRSARSSFLPPFPHTYSYLCEMSMSKTTHRKKMCRWHRLLCWFVHLLAHLLVRKWRQMNKFRTSVLTDSSHIAMANSIWMSLKWRGGGLLVRFDLSASEWANERVSKWTSEQMNEWASSGKCVNEHASRWTCKQMID